MTNTHSGLVLGQAYRGLIGGFLLLRNFSVAISVSLHVCFILVLSVRGIKAELRARVGRPQTS